MADFDVPWGLVIFLIGLAYGYFARGTQDKSEIFKKALLWGLVIGVVLALLGWLFGAGAIGVGLIAVGIVGFLITVAILTLFFVLGVWIGDWLETKFKGGTHDAS